MSEPEWMKNRGIHGGWPHPKPQHPADLNRLVIDNETSVGLPLPQVRRNLPSVSSDVEVVFVGLVERLIKEIERWPVVIGCTAWLTETRVLNALAAKKMVSLLVQKEDFLRPDDGQTAAEAYNLTLKLYARLPVRGRHYDCPGISDVSGLSVASDDTLAPIRCVGVRPDDPKSRNHPRMHHKFMVFCDLGYEKIEDGPDGEIGGYERLIPKVVWTGSFNPTTNGSRSLENAVIINSPEIAEAYAREHAILLAVSEPLNWSERYVAPEYRIGT